MKPRVFQTYTSMIEILIIMMMACVVLYNNVSLLIVCNQFLNMLTGFYYGLI